MCMQPMGKPRDVKDYVEELLKLVGKWELLTELKNWEVPRFPVDGATLKANGCPQGRLMGSIIDKLKVEWVKAEFKSTTEELLAHLPRILEELNIVDGKPSKKPKVK